MESTLSTEEKIKQAARNVFHQKGFAGTKTRDIAEEAGINLALLNYYFRSKQKLFEIIMLETMKGFMQTIADSFNDPSTSLQEKVQVVVNKYIDLLLEEPEIPLFILSEIRQSGSDLVHKMGMKDIIMNSLMIRQYKDHMVQTKREMTHPLQFFMSLLGMTVFPFIAQPMITVIGDLNKEQFQALMEERREIIPKTVMSMLDN